MDNIDETVDKILAEKPIKPILEVFDLNEHNVEQLKNFRKNSKKKASKYLQVSFWILTLISALTIIIYDVGYGYIILTTIGSAILVWGVFPTVLKWTTKSNFEDFIFDKTKTSEIASINEKNNLFEAALSEYKTKNFHFERVIGRATNNYWFSLNPKAFEEAVAELFVDNGWDVYTTPVTRDGGVDLFIEKDGLKAVVQCKTYKKVLGPNAARDLYGTMIANNASHAYLAAPGGFSSGTKSFCEGKPITLLDVDELSKMFYPFEDYTRHWINSAKSMDDIRKGLKKHVYNGKSYNGRRRY